MFHVSGRKVTKIDSALWAHTEQMAAVEFRRIYGVFPHTINDRPFLGLCDNCGAPVFEDEPHGVDDGANPFCWPCTDDSQTEFITPVRLEGSR